MMPTQLVKIDMFTQLIEDYPESTAKIYVMKLIHKLKAHLSLPQVMQDNDKVDIYVTELIFSTVLINLFTLSGDQAVENGQVNIGKAYAIFNTLFNALPCTLGYLVGNPQNRWIKFKKIFRHFLKTSTLFGVVYGTFFTLQARSETGISGEFAAIRSLTYAVGVDYLARNATVTAERLLTYLLKPDEDVTFYALWKDPETEKRNAQYKATYLEATENFGKIQFMYFMMFMCIILFISALPSGINVLSTVGLTHPYATNNILHPVLLLIAALLNYTVTWLRDRI